MAFLCLAILGALVMSSTSAPTNTSDNTSNSWGTSPANISTNTPITISGTVTLGVRYPAGRRLQAGSNASNSSNASNVSAALDFMSEDLADEAVEHGLAAASGAHRDHIVATFALGQGLRLGEAGAVVVASYTVYVQPNATYDPKSVHSKLTNINVATLDGHIDAGMAAMSLDGDYNTTVSSVPDPTYKNVSNTTATLPPTISTDTAIQISGTVSLGVGASRRLQAAGGSSNASAAQAFMNEDLSDEAVEHGLAAASGAHRHHIVATFALGQGRRLGEVGANVVASYTVYVQPDATYDPASVYSNLANIDEATLDGHIDNGMAAMSLDDDYDTTVVSVPDPTYQSDAGVYANAKGFARVDISLAAAIAFVLMLQGR